MVLSLKLKQRQKALKNAAALIGKGEFNDQFRCVEHVLISIVNYLIFGGDSQIQN